MTQHTTLNLPPTELRKLEALALQLGYTLTDRRGTFGNLSAMFRALANGKLVIVRAEQTESEKVS